jgi:hypothetical protein
MCFLLFVKRFFKLKTCILSIYADCLFGTCAGEIFGGLVIRKNENDGTVLFATLGSCCGCTCHSSPSVSNCKWTDAKSHQSIPQVLSKLRGPWALIYWQVNICLALSSVKW